LESPGVFICKISRTWKVPENDLGSGKYWNLLTNDAGDSFWLQIAIIIIVATRYVFWAAGMPKYQTGSLQTF